MTDLDTGCYDLRAKGLRDKFAGFGRLPVSIDQLSVLELAKRVCVNQYGEHFVGDKVWLTSVSGIDRYSDTLKDWSRGFLGAFATMRPVKSKRRLIASYTPVWGDVAALDGLQVAIFGKCTESALARSTALGVDRDAYTRARNYVAGALFLQASQFEAELAWSFEYHRKDPSSRD